MWRIDTIWFDLSVVMSIFAVGNILFGHFEEHKSKWGRVLKVLLVAGTFLLLNVSAGRFWGYAMISLLLLGAAVVHLWWLPKHGINGWTGEPKDKYYELIGVKR
jgi:quinol-cytochrome oxidoreductase complex cytochrome b subunit